MIIKYICWNVLGIPGEFWCDPEGIWDCPDGGDEANCNIKHPKGIARRRPQGVKLPNFVRAFGKGLERERLKEKTATKKH